MIRKSVDVERSLRDSLARKETKIHGFKVRFHKEGFSCCPSCAFGHEYTVACDDAERTRGMLVVWLMKRGTDKALQEAKWLASEGVNSEVSRYIARFEKRSELKKNK